MFYRWQASDRSQDTVRISRDSGASTQGMDRTINVSSEANAQSGITLKYNRGLWGSVALALAVIGTDLQIGLVV